MEQKASHELWSSVLLPTALILGLVLLLSLNVGQQAGVEPMPNAALEPWLKLFAGYLGAGAEIAAALVIGAAVLRAMVAYLSQLFRRSNPQLDSIESIRLRLGRVLALGLGVIGNIGRADEVGSVEYGVQHLGTPLLVVLGHSQCGAVTAAVTHAEVHGNIPLLLAHIKPTVEIARRTLPELKGSDLVPEAVRVNVFQSIEELFRRSEIIRNNVRAGKLKVVGAIYDINSGLVNQLGTHSRQNAFLARGMKPYRSGKRRVGR